MRNLRLITALLIAGAITSRAAEKDELSTFMRAKLEHSQKVLEGLTTENFEMVARHAQAMTLLSQDEQWRVLQTQEYLQRSGEFRRAVETLNDAARKNNLDGATLAYVDVTMKCVECHKYVRRVRQAQTNSRAPVERLKR